MIKRKYGEKSCTLEILHPCWNVKRGGDLYFHNSSLFLSLSLSLKYDRDVIKRTPIKLAKQLYYYMP